MRDGELSDLESILAAALKLDSAFLSLFSSIPAAWKYGVVFTDSNPDLVFDGYYHVYQDYGVAQIRNFMRACRILLNRAIRDVLLEGFLAKPPVFFKLEHTTQFQISTDSLFQLRDDILASVPQYVGYDSKSPGCLRCLTQHYWPLSGLVRNIHLSSPLIKLLACVLRVGISSSGRYTSLALWKLPQNRFDFGSSNVSNLSDDRGAFS